MGEFRELPTGRVLEPSASEWAFGPEHYSASFLADYEPSTLSGHVSPRFRRIASDRALDG
jgi:hypothetical protein